MKTRRAYNAPFRVFALRGLCFVLGAAAVMFMGVVCVRRGPGARQTLLLLDAFTLLCLIAAHLAQVWLHRLCGRELTALRAAAERHENGSARIVYACGESRYILKIPRSGGLPRSGMVDICIDAKRPRAVIPGEKTAPERGAHYDLLLALLTAALNAVYFLL